MNILVAHNFYKLAGGEDQCVAAEIAMLQAHGHRVTQYYLSNDATDGMRRLELAGRTIWSHPAFLEMRRLVGLHRPQVVHFHNTFPLMSPAAYYAARAEGVPRAAPGDRLRVQIDRIKGSVSFASIQEIITPSPQRIAPPCPYFGRCGGCDFQQLTYEAQLETKKEIIRDCLRRIGGIRDLPDFQITPAPNQWHYRTRAQWQYDDVRQRLGYFESGSRRVCDVAECAVLASELQQTLESLRDQMRAGSLTEETRDFRAVAGDDHV